jgi:transcription antitermination factor NusG
MLFGTEPFWFAIQVKPGFELSIALLLRSKGYEEFAPTYRTEEGGRGPTERPLFSGYVFCRFDPVVRAPIVTTPGVIRVVGYGKRPASLNESEMQAVRTVASSNLPAKPYPYLAPGQRVRIHEGPLRGVEGDVVQTGDRRYLVISVSLLQRSIAVRVKPAWLAAMQADARINGSVSHQRMLADNARARSVSPAPVFAGAGVRCFS